MDLREQTYADGRSLNQWSSVASVLVTRSVHSVICLFLTLGMHVCVWKTEIDWFAVQIKLHITQISTYNCIFFLSISMIDFIKRAATNKTEEKNSESALGRPAGRSIGSMIVTKVNERESIRYRQIEIQKKNTVQLNGHRSTITNGRIEWMPNEWYRVCAQQFRSKNGKRAIFHKIKLHTYIVCGECTQSNSYWPFIFLFYFYGDVREEWTCFAVLPWRN